MGSMFEVAGRSRIIHDTCLYNHEAEERFFVGLVSTFHEGKNISLFDIHDKCLEESVSCCFLVLALSGY